MNNNKTYHDLMAWGYLRLEKLCKCFKTAYLKFSEYFAYKKHDYARGHRMLDYADKMHDLAIKCYSKSLDHKYYVRAD